MLSLVNSLRKHAWSDSVCTGTFQKVLEKFLMFGLLSVVYFKCVPSSMKRDVHPIMIGEELPHHHPVLVCSAVKILMDDWWWITQKWKGHCKCKQNIAH